MIDVLYITGAGRSGSTLLESLLGQIHGTVPVGELRHLWHEDPDVARCGCGRLFVECDFWREVLHRADIAPNAAGFLEMFALQRRVDRLRYLPRMLVQPLAGQAYGQRYELYTQALRRVYCAAHDVGDGRVIIDSSKDISMLYLLTQMSDVRLRLLHLVRDSRAVAYSLTKITVRPHVLDQVTYMNRYSPAGSAADWLYRNTLSEAARGRADSYMRLRYEDLIAEPHSTLRRIADFMGLANADLSFIERDEVRLTRTLHTVAGNPMKFQSGGLRLRLDDTWQEALAPASRALVTGLTWPLLRRYGYQRDGQYISPLPATHRQAE